MNALVPILMFGWIPAVLWIFAMLPARRAAITAFLIAWLFLPMAEYKVPGITAYTKMTATCAGIMLAAAMFDTGRILGFRPSWVDLPMAVWCLCPIASSMTNNLGVYDGVSAATYQTITWGLPYLIGRLYFSDSEGLRELAIGIFIGGLIYTPLCLYEIKMSPQLHQMVYGYSVASWLEVKRFGGWRPMVFMQHGLMVGMWMATASLVGLWLWMTGALYRLWSWPIAWLVVPLVVTTILCKSSGAIALLGVGLLVLFLMRWFKTSLPVWCLIAAAPLYMGFRATGQWNGAELVSASLSTAGDERADSLAYRLRNEDMLAEKALKQPFFGWGGWGRNRVYNEDGQDISVTDGLWIIALGQHGVVGLAALTAAMLLPGILLMLRCPVRSRGHAALAPATALVVLLALYMIDNLMNGMVNPIFALVSGAAAGFSAGTLPTIAHAAGAVSRGDRTPRTAPAFAAV